MLARKTKRGASLKLSRAERETLWTCLVNYLETSSVRLMNRPTDLSNLNPKLYYAVLNRFFVRTNFKLNLAADEHLHLEPAEVLMVLWVLRNGTDMTELNMKAILHQLSI